MTMKLKSAGFGQKGVGDQAQSFAQTLLSGRPVGRDQSQARMPKLKPRPKAKFGRRVEQYDGAVHQRRTVFWGLGILACVSAVAYWFWP